MKNIEKEILFKKRFLMFVKVFLVAIIVSSFFYFLGFRIQPNLRISKNANIVLDIKEKGATAQIGNIKITTDKENDRIRLKLPIKENTIKISKEGFFVWQKSIYPNPKEDTYIKPLFKKISSSGVFIKANDPEYYSIYNKTTTGSPLPTSTNPKIIDGVKIWAEKNTILVNKGSEDFGIFESSENIRTLDFYKNDKDYVIYSADNGIYILEINQDYENFQNTFPVYTGKKPVFIYKNENSIYVVDDKDVLELEI